MKKTICNTPRMIMLAQNKFSSNPPVVDYHVYYLLLKHVHYVAVCTNIIVPVRDEACSGAS